MPLFSDPGGQAPAIPHCLPGVGSFAWPGAASLGNSRCASLVLQTACGAPGSLPCTQSFRTSLSGHSFQPCSPPPHPLEAESGRARGSCPGGCSRLPISCHFLVFPTVVASVFSSLLSLSVLSLSLSLQPLATLSALLARSLASLGPPRPSHLPIMPPRPLPSLEAQGLGLGGLPAWARGPEWKTVVQTAPPAPTVPRGLSRVSWGLKPLPAQTPIPPR